MILLLNYPIFIILRPLLSVMSDITTLTKTLSETRKSRGWSQKRLADQLGMKQSQISDVEAGKRDPRLSTLVEVARAVGLELVLIPRPMLPALSYLMRPPSSTPEENQHSMYEFWTEEENLHG
jgi:transcriptional regulator with XRE-family HTH domain